MIRRALRPPHEMRYNVNFPNLQCAQVRCPMVARSVATILLVFCFLGAPIAKADTTYAYTGTAKQSYPAPVTDPYTIQADDQLRVQVLGTQGFYSLPTQNGEPTSNAIPALSQTVTVLSDGTVSYPLIGSISVAGLQPDAAAQRISSALTAFVIHPVVTVMVERSAQAKIEVLGSVEHGGQFALGRDERLVDALVQAGVGSNSYADLNHITLNRVVDGTPKLYNINAYNMLLNGDYSANPLLQAGDVVYVPKAKQHNLADFANLPFALYYLHLIPGGP